MSLLALAVSLLPRRRPRPKIYRYKYQPNPFAGPHFFTVEAFGQKCANALAKKKYAEMFRNRQTVTLDFWPLGPE